MILTHSPGTQIYSDLEGTAVGTFKTDLQESKNLVISPISLATLTTESDVHIMQLSVVVFIPKTTPHTFTITQLYTTNASGLPELQFYICTDYLVHSGTNNFDGYQLNFTADSRSLPEGIHLRDIATVESFLWNKDPKTSRGTVTTVKVGS